MFFNEPELCEPSFSNEFYEITAAQRRHLFVSENVFIAGRRHTVTKIMVYKESWVKRNYHDPMCAERDPTSRSASDETYCVVMKASKAQPRVDAATCSVDVVNVKFLACV